MQVHTSMGRRARSFLPVACLALWSVTTAAQEVITLSNGEWPPYLSAAAPFHGPISRIVSEAFALEGVTVQYTFRPWSRAYAEAVSGSVNGSIVWSGPIPGADRAKHFYFSDVVFEGESVFFHLKSYPFEWNRFDQLAGIK